MMRVTLRQLDAVVAIANTRAVTQAARLLKISQPTVTRLLADTEAALGGSLFTRSSKGMIPTALGETLIRHSIRILAELQRTEHEIAAVKGGAAGRVAIGTAPIGAAELVPRAAATLLAARPDIVLDVVEGEYQPMMDALRAGALDFVIAPLYDTGPEEGLVEELLLHEEWCLIVRRGHPLLKRSKLRLVELESASWILPPEHLRFRKQIDNFFRQNHLRPPERGVTTQSMRLVETLLLESDLIAALSSGVFRKEIEAGLLRVLPVVMRAPLRPVGLITRADAELSPAAAIAMNEIRRVAGLRGRDVGAA